MVAFGWTNGCRGEKGTDEGETWHRKWAAVLPLMQRKRLRAITKSVADWTWRHMSTAGFSARQSRIGTRGNAKRWADHVPTEVTKP
jgi:hypothetical protein